MLITYSFVAERFHFAAQIRRFPYQSGDIVRHSIVKVWFVPFLVDNWIMGWRENGTCIVECIVTIFCTLFEKCARHTCNGTEKRREKKEGKEKNTTFNREKLILKWKWIKRNDTVFFIWVHHFNFLYSLYSFSTHLITFLVGVFCVIFHHYSIEGNYSEVIKSFWSWRSHNYRIVEISIYLIIFFFLLNFSFCFIRMK